MSRFYNWLKKPEGLQCISEQGSSEAPSVCSNWWDAPHNGVQTKMLFSQRMLNGVINSLRVNKGLCLCVWWRCFSVMVQFWAAEVVYISQSTAAVKLAAWLWIAAALFASQQPLGIRIPPQTFNTSQKITVKGCLSPMYDLLLFFDPILLHCLLNFFIKFLDSVFVAWSHSWFFYLKTTHMKS